METFCTTLTLSFSDFENQPKILIYYWMFVGRCQSILWICKVDFYRRMWQKWLHCRRHISYFPTISISCRLLAFLHDLQQISHYSL